MIISQKEQQNTKKNYTGYFKMIGNHLIDNHPIVTGKFYANARKIVFTRQSSASPCYLINIVNYH